MPENSTNSENLFRSLIKNHSSVMLLIAPLSGKIVYANKAAEDFYGYPARTLMQMNISDINQLSPEEITVRMDQAFHETTRRFIFPHKLANGEVRTVEVHSSKITIESLDYLFSIIHDITDRITSENVLLKKEEQLELAKESAGVGVWDWDFASGQLAWSKELFSLFGLDHEKAEASFDTWRNVLHPDDLDAASRCIEEAIENHSRLHNEYRVIHPDGSIHWISAIGQAYYGPTGEATRMTGICLDITAQKQSEELLKQSAHQYDVITNTTTDGFWVFDLEGNVRSANRTCCTMYGYSREEIVTKNIHDFEVLESVEETREHFKNIESNQYDRFVTQHRRKDGTILDVEVSTSYIPGYGILAFIRDITDRKSSEDALAKSERFLKTIIETEPECIKLLDSDCNLLMMNPAGLAMIEADSLEQVKGHCICSLITTPYRDAFSALTKQVFQGIPGTLEFETVGLKGRHIWLETHAVPFRNEGGEIVSLLGITRNITGRKKGEKALQESKELLAEIIELSPISMAIVSMDGTIEQINRRAIETFGYSPDDIPNMERWWVQAYPDDSYRAEVIAQWTGLVGKALAEKSEIERREYRVTCRDGTVKSVLIFGIPVSEKVFVMFDDITDRKRAEEDRLFLERQLLQAQKMESLGVLAGGIAHDFNNILTAIVGNIELALMRLNPESPVLDNLKRIEKGAIRATDLAKQMLAYSGKGKFVVEAIDLNRLVEEMGHMLEVSISKKAVLRFNLTKPLPSVEADATQIRQIVMNLVINASEAIGEKSGVIAITTGCINCDRNYLNNAWLNNDLPEGLYVFLEVADTGCGMDKDTQARMFDPFFSTKFTGRGLGMAAVQGIVRGHKGAINVYSELGKGSSFKLLFPAGTKPAVHFDSETDTTGFRGEGTILLVDDEETVRSIGTEMLTELGYTVITANDGKEAVELYASLHGLFCVILDLTMPHMDGEQTFRALRMIDPDVKVVMSSGYSEYEVTQKFAGKGLSGFIQKPYKMSSFQEVLKKIS